MRLFFAVTAAEEVRAAIGDAIESSPLRDAPWRWIPPDNYHLTLKFLGDVSEERLPALSQAAKRAALGNGIFRMTFGRFGGFPGLGRPRVLFYEVDGGKGELVKLAAGLESELESLGFPAEGKPFRPHLTLARIKYLVSLETRERFSSMPSFSGSLSQQVDHFVLMRSRLSRSGATYEEYARYDLAST